MNCSAFTQTFGMDKDFPSPSKPAIRTGSMGRQFIAYASAGAVGTVAHYFLLLVLVMLFAVNPVAASAAGFLAGLLINYLLSHHWVFSSRKRHRETAFKFLVISSAGLALNTGLMHMAFNVIGIHYLLSQLAATAVVLLWNFAGNRFWTFADETKRSA